MSKNSSCLIIDASQSHQGLCGALVEKFSQGVRGAGHETTILKIKSEKITAKVCKEIQSTILASQHLVFAFPIWSGMPPYSLVELIQKVFVEGFAFEYAKDSNSKIPKIDIPATFLITMGMQGPPDVQYLSDGLAYSGVFADRTIVVDGVKPGMSKNKIDNAMNMALSAGENTFLSAQSWPFNSKEMNEV